MYYRSSPAVALACLLISAGTGHASEPATPELSTERTVRAELKPGKASKPVPNSAMDLVDEETMKLLAERWNKLAKSNKRYRHEPEVSKGDLSKVRPWTAPAITRSTARRGNPLLVESEGTPTSAVAANSSATVNEPSVMATGDYIFYTGNWYASASTDGGQDWTFVNPFTGPFPDPPGASFCCDQQVHFDSGSGSVFWLQQMIPDSTSDNGTQRINVDQGANGTWDCFYDVTGQAAGFPDATFPDYPDFSVSNDHLFVTSNVFSNTAFHGGFVARLPLAQITTCAAATVDYFTSSTFGSFRTTQGAGDVMYFADHVNTTSLRVWSWPSSSATPTSVDRAHTAYSNATRACPGPDNRDWCGAIDSRLFGAAVAGNRVGFFWTAAQNPAGGFPFPYTQGLILDANNSLAVVEQPLIWSNDAAWVYSSAAGNTEGDFAGTILWGGGTHFPQCSAWLVDDVNSNNFDPLEHQVLISGTTGPNFNRSGDYLATRVYHPNDRVFAGSCFSHEASNAAVAKYALFGRSSNFDSSEIFNDGFEAGNTSAWSSSLP